MNGDRCDAPYCRKPAQIVVHNGEERMNLCLDHWAEGLEAAYQAMIVALHDGRV